MYFVWFILKEKLVFKCIINLYTIFFEIKQNQFDNIYTL